MTCRINSDTDRCRLHRTPVEHMHFCEHDGPTCVLECPHPSCHRVEAKYKRDTFLGVKWFSRCSLCGEKGPDEVSKDEALAWEQMHHEAVAK